MRKFHILILGLMALLVTLTGCKDESISNDYATPPYNAIAFECQSTWGASNQTIWSVNSEVGLFCQQTKSENSKIALSAASINTPTGLFYTKTPWTNGEHQFYIYSPYSERTADNIVVGTLDGVQIQVSDNTDHITTNSLSYANVKSSEIEGPIAVNMKSVFGYINYSLTTTKYTGWNVKSIVLTSGSATFAGNYTFDLKSGKLAVSNGTKTLELKVTGISTCSEEVFDTYVVSTPTVIKNSECTIEMLIQKEGQEDLLLDGTIAMTKDIVAGEIVVIPILMDNLNENATIDNSIDLSQTAGTANSYIANTAGATYRFPATVMGNGYTTPATEGYAGSGSAAGHTPTTLTPTSAELMWQTERSLISDINLKKGYVYFSLNGSASTPLKEGNALIAVFDKAGNILWSWHIWVTEADIEGKTQTYTLYSGTVETNPINYQSYSAYSSPIVMDRNLGATSNGMWITDNNNNSHGLKYQWGRKDPFLGADNSALASLVFQSAYDKANNTINPLAYSATISGNAAWISIDGTAHSNSLTLEEITKHPMCYVANSNDWLASQVDDLWGSPYTDVADNNNGHKSIYDPCPPGWRVPHRFLWTGFTTNGLNATKITAATWETLTTVTNGVTAKTDGGYTFKYSGSATTTYPTGGMLNKASSGALFRVGNYASGCWSNSPFAEISVGNAAILYADYANINNPKGNGRTYGYGVRCMKER